MSRASGGLTKWYKQNWVDIGTRKKDGSFAKCGRSKKKSTISSKAYKNMKSGFKK